MEYPYRMDPHASQALAEEAMRLAGHIHDQGYKAIVVAGGSNSLSRSLLALGWGARYPGEKLPPILVFGERGNRLLYKYEHAGDTDRHDNELQRYIDEEMPRLNAYREDRICFVDDYARTGDKLTEVEAALKRLGFANIDFAVFATITESELRDGVYRASVDRASVTALYELSQHIQGKPTGLEIARGEEEQDHKKEALRELRGIGRRMR